VNKVIIKILDNEKNFIHSASFNYKNYLIFLKNYFYRIYQESIILIHRNKIFNALFQNIYLEIKNLL
jgi:hypothetical protein